MSIASFSVKNRLFVNLISVFLLLAGCLTAISMRKEAFPLVNYDIITVDTLFPGASPEEVERFIAIPLEDELKEVDNVKEMTSVSYENRCFIVLEIEEDVKNLDRLISDVQQAVDQARDELPDDAEDPIVNEINSRDEPVLFVSLAGDIDEHRLQDLARTLEDRLLDITNVGRIERTGWRDREIWAEVDPATTAAYHLSLSEIMQALRNKNLNLPGGNLRVEDEEVLVRTMGELKHSTDVGEVIIRGNDQGNWIRVKDVANVSDAFKDDELVERTKGSRAITLTVIKRERGDVIKVVDEAERIAKDFEKNHPEIRVSFFNDISFYVKRRLNVLVSNGLIGIVLVVAALLVFMNFSTAMMTAIGLPVAFATTFFLMFAFGMTINLITMFALIMVVGLLVDDAIVVSENIYRYIDEGMNPHEAAVKGAQEVMGPVISTVLTTIAAFIPIFFMAGMMGKFTRAIPVVVVIALSASLLEALAILPSHMADFVRKTRGKKNARGEEEAHWFVELRQRYTKLLLWVLNHRYMAAGIITAIFIVTTIVHLIFGRFVLFPKGLIEQFSIIAECPIGTALDETSERIRAIEREIAKLPDDELDNYVTRVGIIQESPTDPARTRGSHVGQITAYLTPAQTRKRPAQDIMESLRPAVEKLPGFERVSFELARAGPPVGKPVQIEIRGETFERIEPMAEEFKTRLATVAGVKDIRDDYEEGKQELRIKIDDEKAAKTGLSTRAVADELRSAFEGGEATSIRTTDEEIEIIVKTPVRKQTDTRVLNEILIPNGRGRLIPLDQIAHWTSTPGISEIRHLDRQRVIKVTAEVDEDVVTPIEIARHVEAWLGELEGRYPDNIVHLGGEQEETAESLGNFFRAFILAFFLIFLILASQFNSLIQPLVVMLAIPFGVVGVIWAFLLHGQPMSFMSLLGLIGLSGVVVNDSIVLVDFINKQRAAGLSRRESIVQACRLRLRPVLLTSITTVLGLGPVAYGIGGFDPFVAPMALAISWGLFCATGLTLLIIPCVYAIVDDTISFISRFFRRLKLFRPSRV